jgi:hypothetical protein
LSVGNAGKSEERTMVSWNDLLGMRATDFVFWLYRKINETNPYREVTSQNVKASMNESIAAADPQDGILHLPPLNCATKPMEGSG